MSKTKNISEFGYSFQVKFIVCLITDKLFLEQIVDILDEKYINNDGFKWIVKEIREYYNEYKTVPTMEVFKVELENLNKELQNVAVKDLLKQAYKSSKATDLGFVKDTFLDFCKNQTLKGALMKSVDLLELGDYDDIRNLIDGALKAGTERDIEAELQDSTIQLAVENVANENNMSSQEEMMQEEEAPMAEETMPTGLMARRA